MTIEIGTAIVSYIEPAPGYARAFNEWYERDHFPAAVLAGPGVFSGARFVATRACKQQRRSDAVLFGDPARGSYLALAWVVPDKQAEWDAWVAREMETITAQGRLFPEREHVHTAVYEFSGATGSIVTALVHGYAGVVVQADEHDVKALDNECAIDLVLQRTIVSSANPPAHRLRVDFCANDPLTVFDAHGLTAGFASAFVATIPGTDAYTEDL
ncbi:MAG TPA: hypothetical protein VL856_06070 [Acidimicrobiia bacterium]|nr:hypothetical protein [Acidimicrobiia bacterium]